MDLNLESITIGYVFKAQFFLPENVSNILNPLNDPFDLTTRPITGMNRRKRSSNSETPSKSMEHNKFDSEQNEWYERHEVNAETVEIGTETESNSDDNIDDELWFEDKNGYSEDDVRALNIPKYFGTTRFSLYKGIAAVADRLIYMSLFKQSKNKFKKKIICLFIPVTAKDCRAKHVF